MDVCYDYSSILQGLCDILGTNGFVQFFVDDGNLAGDFEYLYAAIQYIQNSDIQ